MNRDFQSITSHTFIVHGLFYKDRFSREKSIPAKLKIDDKKEGKIHRLYGVKKAKIFNKKKLDQEVCNNLPKLRSNLLDNQGFGSKY